MELGHKRSKSSRVKSLLQRVSSRDDVTEGVDTSSLSPVTSDPTSSPVQQMAPLGPSLSRQSTRPKPHLSMTTSHHSTQESLVPPSPSRARVPPSPSTSTQGTSIEQSVRLFRLFEALRNGDTAAISKAIREQSGGGSEENVSSHTNGRLEGTSILHLAIQCAETPVIEFVLSQASSAPSAGLDINGRDKDGNTPLHIAAQLGRAPVVRMLLDQKGINDCITNYQGQTPLDLARTPEIFQQLQLSRSLFIDTNIKKVQSLIAAKDHENLEKLLHDSRVKSILDINGSELATDQATVETGGTLLHQAARQRDHKLIQMLLFNGADPFRRDRKGKLPQDVTKDEGTKALLKKSPAAAAAQRGIQEKTILAGGAPSASGPSDALGGKEGREMKGYLKKWTNYTTGYKLRWFVLEDGVLSYYKHQDDAGSACRGAINMKIATLHMDPQDKLRFEIVGKNSVKYHLKANHQVEAKRWFWALNNAIQWSKDEAKEEEQRHNRETQALQQAKSERADKRHTRDDDMSSLRSSKLADSGKGLVPSTSLGVPLTSTSSRAGGSTYDDDGLGGSTYEPSMAGAELSKVVSNAGTTAIEGDVDDDEEYGDDASSHEAAPAGKDAFTITAQSAKLQLDLLAQVSAALQAERTRNPSLPISDPVAAQAFSSYDAAVSNLKGLIGDLLRISKDRDAYWQYRLDREANIRRMWEDSMARVAKEQEELGGRMEESEEMRKKTKRALKEALEEMNVAQPVSPEAREERAAVEKMRLDTQGATLFPPKDDIKSPLRRKSTLADFNIPESDSEEDEEFFDAIGTGEVEVVESLPQVDGSVQAVEAPPVYEDRKAELESSFKGYEDPLRKRLKLDADDRPKISLWGILKSMIGKDMTKMTLPVSFNEPTSLLQRVAEDMEYTDLLDIAAERMDSTERMLYVAAFAASEYASTIGRVAKPFNPLLGETYEYARPDKGYRFFIEQVSHHPPIGAAWAESPKWDYYGESAVKSKFYGKSFDINPLGTWFLHLRPTSAPPELYTWKKVTTSVIGIITGTPTVDNYGPMEITNHTTGETCLLDFKPRGWKASSAYQVAGRVTDKNGRVRWSVGGRWNDKIYARLTPGYEASDVGPGQGDKHGENKAFLVWACHPRPQGTPFNLTPFGLTLNALPDRLRPLLPPTDCRLRPDQRAMEDGEYDKAAEEKARVEEKQRAKRREREARGEEFQPMWFRRAKCEVSGEEYWAFGHEYWKVRDRVAKGDAKWEEQGLEDIF